MRYDTEHKKRGGLMSDHPMFHEFFLASADADGWPDCSYKGGAQVIARVRAQHIFPNWPRYIHRMQRGDPARS
jgi:hypothetical protein